MVEVPQSESVELHAVSTLHKTGSEEATPLPTTTVTTAYSPVIVQIVEIKPPTPIPVQSQSTAPTPQSSASPTPNALEVTPVIIPIGTVSAGDQVAAHPEPTAESDQGITSIRISNPSDPAPTITVGLIEPGIPKVGENVQLLDTTASMPESGRALVAAIDWGDGTGFQPVTIIQETGEIIAGHSYSQPGVYMLTIRVRVDQGAESKEVFNIVVE